MASLQPSTRIMLERAFSAKREDINLLAINQYVASPNGYADRMNYTGLFSVTVDEKTQYIECDPFYAASLREVDEVTAKVFIHDCVAKKQSACSPDFESKPTDLWLSKAEFDNLELTVSNPFSSYIVRVNADGSFSGLDFKKGDLIRLTSSQHLDKFPEEIISHVHIYSGYGERLAPGGVWHINPLNGNWNRQ